MSDQRTMLIGRWLWLSAFVAVGLIAPVGVSGEEVVLFYEGFEQGNELGWDFYGPGSDALEGTWEIGDPVGTTSETPPVPAQPELAWSGTGCAFTAQNTTAGAHDVDGGVVYLVSPLIDLSSTNKATLSYARWFYNRDRGEDVGDYFEVSVRSGSQGSWVPLEYIDHVTLANFWTVKTFQLNEHIDLPSFVQLRFAACDGVPPGSIIEGSVDEVVISSDTTCENNEDCALGEFCGPDLECWLYGDGDFDLDGDLDLEDYMSFQQCFGLSGEDECAPGNMSGDVSIDELDYAEFAAALMGP